MVKNLQQYYVAIASIWILPRGGARMSRAVLKVPICGCRSQYKSAGAIIWLQKLRFCCRMLRNFFQSSFPCFCRFLNFLSNLRSSKAAFTRLFFCYQPHLIFLSPGQGSVSVWDTPSSLSVVLYYYTLPQIAGPTGHATFLKNWGL